MVNEMVIAKYIRLSSEDYDVDKGDKAESVSVSSQRKLIDNYIEEHKEFIGIPVREYVDDGFSGTNFDLPSFKKMMDDAKMGRLSVIIVKDLSRFGRDHLEVGNYLERILPILQIRLVAVNDGYDSACLNGMTGGISVALHNIVNAMYSRDLSAKVKSAMKTRAERGEYVAAMPTFGYVKDPKDKHHLVIDEEAAAIVRLVFELVASGKRKMQIVAYLNENGIMTPSEYMAIHGIRKISSEFLDIRLWNADTVNNIIRNERYIGISVWNKTGIEHTGSKKQIKRDRSEWICVEGTHEPIVSKELFEKANTILERNCKKRDKTAIPETNKALFICPYCGRSITSDKRNKKYTCKKATSSGIAGCRTVNADADLIQEKVLELVNEMAKLACKPDRNSFALSGTGMTEESIARRLKQIEQEHIRIKSDKLNIYTAYRTERLTKEEYLKEYGKLTERMTDLNHETDELKSKKEELQEELTRKESEVKKLKEVAALTEFDKVKVMNVIDKVLVYDNEHIGVRWKCRDIFNEPVK